VQLRGFSFFTGTNTVTSFRTDSMKLTQLFYLQHYTVLCLLETCLESTAQNLIFTT
jgi:hypothetical protein